MLDNDATDWINFCKGDSESLERIYRRHKDRLMTYCYYVTHQRETSEDIVQETFRRVIDLRKDGNRIVSVGNWLFICARNLALNQLSRYRTRKSQPAATSDTTLFPDPETRRFVEKVLQRLDPDERDLILLREHEQYSICELSEMLDLSEEAVRVRLFRIRKKMQTLAKEPL